MTSPLHSLLTRTHPSLSPSDINIDIQSLNAQLFPKQEFTDADIAAIKSWIAGLDTADLNAINTHLATRTTILGHKTSVADLATYAVTAPQIAKLDAEKRTGAEGVHHVVRHVAFVENAAEFGIVGNEGLKGDVVGVDLDDVKVVPKIVVKKVEGEGEKDKKKEKKGKKGADKAGAVAKEEGETKELPIRTKKPEQDNTTASAAGAPAGAPTQKREKKEKKPKQQKPAPAPAQLPSPSIIDLRVGHILRATTHPNADSLYVSTINCGDAPGTENTSLDEETGLTVRTVCSGLNGLVPLEEMQGRKIVAVCNLKPVTMRGIKSCAMVLAASPRPVPGVEEDAHAGPVELVSPPEHLPAGTRLFFENWKEGTPEKVLNPKKKIWEAYQPGFTTTEALEVGFDPAVCEVVKGQESAGKGVGRLVSEDGGVCVVKSLKNAVVR